MIKHWCRNLLRTKTHLKFHSSIHRSRQDFWIYSMRNQKILLVIWRWSTQQHLRIHKPKINPLLISQLDKMSSEKRWSDLWRDSIFRSSSIQTNSRPSLRSRRKNNSSALSRTSSKRNSWKMESQTTRRFLEFLLKTLSTTSEWWWAPLTLRDTWQIWQGNKTRPTLWALSTHIQPKRWPR